MAERLKLAGLLTAGSLFSQWVCWYAYARMSLEVQHLIAFGLVLCLLYHALQYDAGEGRLLTRGQVFRGTAVYPLLLTSLLVGVIYLSFPALPLFGGTDDNHAAQQLLAKYGMRMSLSSAALLLFALPDYIFLSIFPPRGDSRQNSSSAN